MSNSVIIYHGDCTDGFGAAFSAWWKYGDRAMYYPGMYQQEPPYGSLVNKHVYICDFSYPIYELMQIKSIAKNVTILDHHKTAQASIQPLLDNGIIDGIFDMNRSGAMISWQFFNPAIKIPPLIKYIEDHDLWKFQYEDTKQIVAALRSYPMDFEVWKDLMHEPLRLAHEGTILRRYIDTVINALIKTSSYEYIAGYKVPVVNCPPQFASDVGNILCKDELFSASYYCIDSKRIYSLRSNQKGSNFDVSRIAKLFGGGGHHNAAGFKIDENK